MLRNPYLNRSMLRSVELFYGRRVEIQRVMARLDAPAPQSVSIVGERRIGKSSLLWHLGQPEVYRRYLETPDRYLFFYLDFQRQQGLDPAGFCRVFGEELVEGGQGRVDLPILTDFPGLEAAVQQLARQDFRLVGLFDEFDTVVRNAAFGAEFYGLLRSLANAYPVAFVTASHRDLPELCAKREIAESPFFNIFTRLPLGPMPADEVRQLVCQPSADAGLPLEDHLEDILALSGHLPFFVQICCAAVFDCRVERGQDWTWADVEERFRDEAGVHLKYLWDHLDEGKQQALAALVGGATPQADALRALERDGYVLRQGKQYRLFSRSLQRYIDVQPPPADPSPANDLPASPGLTPHTNPDIAPIARGQAPYPDLIGHSEAMRRVFALMRKAIAADLTVLLLGETGVGKELVARTIHQQSTRGQSPFVALNCGAVAEHLLESELFGHKKGSFTGAVADREGLFEAADGGTLFLDEIGEINAAAQVKLLRVLQEGEIRRVGENRPRRVDVRLICATNRALEDEVEQGRFRQDLYYRLYVLAIEVPPLRQRREDIPMLVEHFLQAYSPGIDPQAQALLEAYPWPGNIRELQNQLLSAQAMAEGDAIEPDHLWTRLRQDGAVPPILDLPVRADWTLREGREHFERRFVRQRIDACDGDLAAAAQSLGISRSRLYQLIERFGFKKP